MKTGGFSGAGGQLDGKPVTVGGGAWNVVWTEGAPIGAVMGAGGRGERRFTVIEVRPGVVETPSRKASMTALWAQCGHVIRAPGCWGSESNSRPQAGQRRLRTPVWVIVGTHAIKPA
jgi:hypothetical protein